MSHAHRQTHTHTHRCTRAQPVEGLNQSLSSISFFFAHVLLLLSLLSRQKKVISTICVYALLLLFSVTRLIANKNNAYKNNVTKQLQQLSLPANQKQLQRILLVASLHRHKHAHTHSLLVYVCNTHLQLYTYEPTVCTPYIPIFTVLSCRT